MAAVWRAGSRAAMLWLRSMHLNSFLLIKKYIFAANAS
jgi:hypothetical protein